MGKHSFTPGPWAFDGAGRIDAVALRKPTAHIVKREDGTEVSYMDGLVALPYGRGDGTQNANAALIAAAPDLLAALEALIASHGGTIAVSRDDDRAIAARAAIAAATGDQGDVA